MNLDFEKIKNIQEGVIPAVVQDSKTKEVLIVGYVNKQALEHTLKTKKMTFWSTSRNELWIKGATSGDELIVDNIKVNCKNNSILVMVTPTNGGACHVKDENENTRKSCYFKTLEDINVKIKKRIDERNRK